MKSVSYKSLMFVCVVMLASCNSAQSASNDDVSNQVNPIRTAANINNPFICCNDVPEYCLRGHSQEHILECARLMSKYRKGIIADKGGCNCVQEIDVIQKKVDALSQDFDPDRDRYRSGVGTPERRVALQSVAARREPVAQKVFIQPPTPKTVFTPASDEPVVVQVRKKPVPTFANVVPSPSPKKVALVEQQEEGCNPCKAEAKNPNELDTKGCVCATCVCPK